MRALRHLARAPALVHLESPTRSHLHGTFDRRRPAPSPLACAAHIASSPTPRLTPNLLSSAMPSHELITVLSPLLSLVLATLIDTTTSLQSLVEQLVEENGAQLEREVVGRAGAAIGDWGLVKVRKRAVGTEWAEAEVVDDGACGGASVGAGREADTDDAELFDSSIPITDLISLPPSTSPAAPTTTRPSGPTHQSAPHAPAGVQRASIFGSLWSTPAPDAPPRPTRPKKKSPNRRSSSAQQLRR